jgi:hypothetical protein
VAWKPTLACFPLLLFLLLGPSEAGRGARFPPHLSRTWAGPGEATAGASSSLRRVQAKVELSINRTNPEQPRIPFQADASWVYISVAEPAAFSFSTLTSSRTPSSRAQGARTLSSTAFSSSEPAVHPAPSSSTLVSSPSSSLPPRVFLLVWDALNRCNDELWRASTKTGNGTAARSTSPVAALPSPPST